MKTLKRDLQSVVKSLKLLTKKTEQMAKALEKIDVPRPAKKRPVAKSGKKAVTKKASKKTAAKKATSKTATDTVLSIIKRSRNGLNTAALEKKTGFDAVKVRNIIFRLKRQEKIQSKSRGIYVAI